MGIGLNWDRNFREAAETNYIKANPGEGFQVALRLYGPSKPFFDESWIPDDVVKVK